MLDRIKWNLTGRLFDKAAGSLPLEATEIIVSHLDGETISSGFSDNQGKFTFSLPSGKFVVRYRQLGDILKEAIAQGGEMQKEEVEKFFAEDGLSEEQIDLVCDYLLFLLQLNVILFSKE